MYKRSLKRTLFIYLAYAWLVSTALSAIVLMAEYSPSIKKAIQRFGIGALILNCILWELLFTVTGTASLLNMYEGVRNSFVFSLICFILLPAVAMIVALVIQKNTELFGITESSITFLVTQIFFFFRFRSSLKRTNPLSVD